MYQQLAEAAGISKPCVSQRVIRRLAEARRVDLNDLIRPEPNDETGRSRAAASVGRRR